SFAVAFTTNVTVLPTWTVVGAAGDCVTWNDTKFSSIACTCPARPSAATSTRPRASANTRAIVAARGLVRLVTVIAFPLVRVADRDAAQLRLRPGQQVDHDEVHVRAVVHRVGEGGRRLRRAAG